MSQTLKESIYDAIYDAALTVFAESDYASATMGGIAHVAGVSTGTLYIYFKNKDDLFRAVVPPEFTEEITRRVLRKVAALRGEPDVDALAPDAPYHTLSEELFSFWSANRKRTIIVLLHAAGTMHESFAGDLAEGLATVSMAHIESIRRGPPLTVRERFMISLVCRNFVSGMAQALAEFEDEHAYREATARLTAYHLAGLQYAFKLRSAGARRERTKDPVPGKKKGLISR